MAAWKFEKVYNKTIVGTVKDICFDGKYIWVSTGTNLYAIEFWSPNGDCKNEKEWDELEDTKFVDKLVIKTNITMDAYDLAYHNGYVYVTNKGSNWDTITRINCETFINEGYLEVPQVSIDNNEILTGCNSNLCVGHNKLWMVYNNQLLQSLNDDCSRFTYYDILNDQWRTSVKISSTQKQVEKIYITDGYNGYMYIGSINRLAITKVNGTTGAINSSIRIGNREIKRLYTNQSRDIFVSSDNGLITHVNGETDALTHSYNSLGIIPTQLFDDGTYIWCVFGTNKQLCRINKSNKNIFYSLAGTGPFASLQDDYKLDIGKFTDGGSFKTSTITPEFTYQYYDDGLNNVVVKPYIFIGGVNKIWCFKNVLPLYRSADTSLTAISMISTGEQYFTG